MAKSDSGVGTIVGIGALGLIVYFLFFRGATTASAGTAASPTASNTLMSQLMRALLGNNGTAPAAGGGGGGAPQLPFSGLGAGNNPLQTLANYVFDPNAAAAVALDQGTSLADYSSTIFDNYQIPQDNSGQQLFDTSQLAYDYTPTVDPSTFDIGQALSGGGWSLSGS